MNKFLVRPRTIFVFITFLSSVFVLIFYEGYHRIYLNANFYTTSGTVSEFPQNVARAQREAHGRFLDSVKVLQRRTFAESGTNDGRHKFRWLYKTIEAEAYKLVAGLGGARGPIIASYVRYLHYASGVLVSFLFTFLSISLLRGRPEFNVLAVLAMSYFAYVAYLTTTPNMADGHSIIEMATIAAGLHFSLRRRFVAFLCVLLVAVANRETGAALGGIYAVINWPKPGFWLPLVLGPVMLLAINVDLMRLPEFYEISTYIFVKKTGYVGLFNFWEVPVTYVGFSFLKNLVVIAPLVLIPSRVWRDGLARRLCVIGGVYLCILLFGTFIGNSTPYALLVPVILLLGSLAFPRPSTT